MPGRIVVGVDGSDSSSTALRWAYEEARVRDASIDAVHAWLYPSVGELAGLPVYRVGYEELESDARAALEHSLEQAGLAPLGVPVRPMLVHGGAASVLLDVAKGADLLVVGTRGRGGFTGLLLGSVSQQCAHHATCALAIVPPSWTSTS